VGFLLSALLIYSGLVGIQTGYWHFGGAIALFGLLLGGASVAPIRRRRALGTAPVGTDKGALRIGFSRFAMAQGPVAIGIGAAGGALMAAVGVEAGSWGLLWTVVCGAVAAYGVITLVRWLSGGLTVGELRLSPGEVRLRVDAIDVTVPWDDLTGVFAQAPLSNGMPTGHELCLTTRSPPRSRVPMLPDEPVSIPVHRIDLDQMVLHHLLCFYREHPDARYELAGPAAVTRLRDRAFTD
jgi:hypothetical protein